MLKNLTITEIQRSAARALEALPTFNKAALSSLINRKGAALDYWTRRLVKTGEIISIKRDLFVGRLFVVKIKGRPESTGSYLEYLAGVIRQPSYLSTEYALAKCGALTDVPFAFTSLTVKSSRTFTNEFGSFIYQNIKAPLFCGYTEVFFGDKRYFMATRAKALFDFIYLKTFKRGSLEGELEEGLRINWDAFEKADLAELQDYAVKSKKKKMAAFVNIIVRKGLL